MKTITVKSPAKLNLCLYVNYKRDDGFHDISSIMIPVSIYDIIDFTLTKSPKIEVNCTSSSIPQGKENLAYKAAEILQKNYNIPGGVNITIYKEIPAGAGLGGGSSDAAITLKILNRLWNINLPLSKLMEEGKKIGADIPFFINGMPAIIGGIGDVVGNLNINYDCYFLIIYPEIVVSTKDIYNQLNLGLTKSNKDIKGFVSLIKRERPSPKWEKYLHNDLEIVTISKHKIIGDIKVYLKELGAIASLMGGSGSSVFGLFASEREAVEGYIRARARYKKVYLAKGINNIFNRSQQWK
ncbi:MAG: 4-(cytidine 5'-diphospho)-2-C-methyl-D-erythritol kinase [Candidatus Schekmanbacteria bacterium]|nr:MAG: 4-(cytidine 5'-diphospho)-2-C-methyl-D-erythritol kinase [Candidatus Schekmanbacteria bacterium]